MSDEDDFMCEHGNEWGDGCLECCKQLRAKLALPTTLVIDTDKAMKVFEEWHYDGESAEADPHAKALDYAGRLMARLKEEAT